jgi:hypothetical protein
MANRKKRRREAFFARAAEAIRRNSNETRELFVCPICDNIFTRADLDAGRLTLEDVPPKSMGGKPIALTCKKCNNTSGSTLDAAMRAREDLRSLYPALFRGIGTFAGPAQLSVDGVSVNAELDARGRTFSVVVYEAHNDPAVVRERIEHMQERSAAGQSGSIKRQVTPRKRFHIRRSKIGDLRVAYLAAFAGYGYRYAYDPRLESVRLQLQQPEEEIVQHAWLLEPSNSSSEPMFLGLSRPVPGLAVRLGLVTVLLPWFSSPDDFYGAIDASYDADRRLEIEGEWLGWPRGMEMHLDYL